MADNRAMTCPECRDTGIISRPYIAGVVSTMTACTCDAGRQFAADIAAIQSAQPVIDYRAVATINQWSE